MIVEHHVFPNLEARAALFAGCTIDLRQRTLPEHDGSAKDKRPRLADCGKLCAQAVEAK
jgi:hypothetical protein